MIEDLLLREDRRRYSLSKHELERRWNAIRAQMAEKGINYLVIQSQQRYVSGYFRWFTDIPGANYHITAVFPLDDDMTIISHGAPAPALPDSPPACILRGVKKLINTPAFPNVWWEDSLDANKVVEAMNRKKPITVGLVGLGNMSAALYENLKKGLPNASIVNATDQVDKVRMVKSEEEIKLHRDAAYLHEMSYEVAKEAIRPGTTAYEVIEKIRHAQLQEGSEEQQIVMEFGQPGSQKYRQGSWGNTFARRKLKQGDIINLLIESSAAGGYWYDLRRFLSIGSVPKDLQEAYETVKQARGIMADNCKPGVKPEYPLAASDKFLESEGCPPESRMGGHGQGLDLAERPVIRYDEPAKLEVGMVVALHPIVKTKQAIAYISDTYVITDSGAIPIYKNLFDDDEITVTG